MANPIIKIKRGTGKPQVWNGTTGITAGEFAFDTNTGILYMGMLGAGGYTGHFETDTLYSNLASTIPNVIPVGYQISNDSTFGGINPAIDDTLGYSNYTAPSTYAVREFVKISVIAAAAGVEFNGGTGIQVITTGNAGTTYTIVNTGVLKGFTSAGVAGNAFGDRLYAKSANDGITFVGGGGIALRSSNANGYIEIQNYGVTSINGFTGDIKTFAPISSLAGFSQDVGILLRTAITAVYPIKIRVNDEVGFTGIFVEHEPIETGDNHLAYVNNVPQILGISWDNYGHIAGYINRPLDFRTSSNGGSNQSGLPLGFTEAVQDAAYSGITNASGPNNYGIDYVYDDFNNRLNTINRGITSLSIVNGLGLSGAVNIAGGNGIVMTQNSSLNRVIVNYAGTQYQSFSAERPLAYGYTDNTAGGIYVGGITGPGISQRVVADSTQENLAVIAGRGIGISMGVLQTSDTMMLWNTGINTITAYNSAGAQLGDSGYSGNMAIRAGTNIQLARSGNDLTISSTSGGGGGAISALVATYNTAIPVGGNGGSGVTGEVHIIGQNGLITRQEVDGAGTSTKDGDLYIGLSSKVKIPAAIGTADYSNANYQTLEIATSRENGSPSLPVVGEYLQAPNEYSKLITDIVEGGFTAEFVYGAPGSDIFSPPNLNGPAPASLAFNADKSYPGRILSLRAREGIWKFGTSAATALIAGTHAELRLLGYPNPENMSAYIQGVFDFPVTGNGTGCPGNNCIGMPPILPSCNTGLDANGQEVYYHTDGAGLRNTDSAETGQQRGTSVFHSNIVAQDSIFVQKDIWLTGELIDATTGCLYGVSGGGGSNVFNGGNLGLTGDLVVQGSIYVLGGTAFFHVKDLATESPLVKIGGMSGGTFSAYNGILNNQQVGYTGDRGLLLSTYHANPYSPLTGVGASSATFRQNFVGIDTSEGVFKYVTEAVFSENNGINSLTSGSLGPVKFSEINNVGITSNNITTISLRTGSAGTPPTDIELNGYATIIGPLSSAANRASVTLGTRTKARFGVAEDVGITFNRSIEFSSTANTGNNDFAANSLRIKYLGGSEGGSPGRLDAHRTISIRAPISDGYTQLVDIGRSTTSESNTAYASANNLAQQTIYNKTLADGTIIDCGTY